MKTTINQYAVGAMLSLASLQAAPVTINFDDVAVNPGFAAYTLQTRYLAQGVRFDSMLNASDGVAVGVTFAGTLRADSRFFTLNTDSSPSPNNLALAQNNVVGGIFFASDELLMTFSSPIATLSVVTDIAAGEAPDTVRLLALRSLGSGLYEILTASIGLDNGTTIADNTLTINLPTGFTHAIFESTTEFEGIDNVTFEAAVPEPTTWMMTCGGLGCVLLGRRRKLVN